MSTSINTENPSPDILREAIKQIQHELPELLNSEYSSFMSRLVPLLSEGSNGDLLALFALYPTAYERLQSTLNYLTAGHGLYGNPISTKPSTRYICPVGSHTVDEADIQKKDLVGRPLCPKHGKVLRLAT